MEAYCMKCKTKREMKDPVAAFNANGSPVTIGICLECGTKMYRMGRTPAHESLTPPEKTVKEKKEKVVKRAGKLVIVESPAKARTVGRFLGKGYTVRASVGHVRDLLRSQLSVDVENNFEPKYRVPNEKKEVIKELKLLAKKANEIYHRLKLSAVAGIDISEPIPIWRKKIRGKYKFNIILKLDKLADFDRLVKCVPNDLIIDVGPKTLLD